MYIELGSTKINYKKSTGSNFIILSQVVNSALSYEKPVIVNNIQDFDIWFGRDFSDRDYLIELLSMGISLYLYKPISPEVDNLGIEDYINLSRYSRFKKEITYFELSSTNFKKEEGVIYSVIIDNSKTEDYIWHDNELLQVSDLPQNLIYNNSNSLSNRDTLAIFETEDKEYIYLSPTYITNLSNNEFGSFRKIEDKDINIDNLDYKDLSKNKQTCIYNISIDEHKLFETIDDELNYLVINNKLYGFCSGENFSNKVEKEWLAVQENIGSENCEVIINAKDIDDILRCFPEDSIENNKYILKGLEKVKHYYNISGFSLEPDFNYTNEIVYSKLISNNNYKNKINFISKTIGTGGIDGNIEVKIEKPTSDIYRIIISRFGYTEIFEGKLIGDKDNTSLEELVNIESKLVYCEIIDRKDLPIGDWTLRGGYTEIINGSMYVKSLNSLSNPPEPIYFDYLLIPDIDRFPKDKDITGNYYSIYTDLIQLSKNLGCQILIQNNLGNITIADFKINNKFISKYTVDIKDELHNVGEEYTIVTTELDIYNDSFSTSEKNLIISDKNSDAFIFQNNLKLIGPYVYLDDVDKNHLVKHGNYQYNYIDDSENRLIYFYGSIYIYGNERPGYYLYLMNLLLDTSYSATSDKITYNTPIQEYYTSLFNKDVKNELTKSQLIIVKELDRMKCNYLLSNNHIYYYEKYQNGNSYTTTGWMRFCIEKIKRELIKNKWLILDNRDYSNIEKSIKQILDRIKNNFSIIKDISLADLEISYKDKKIDIKIDSTVSDLVNNDIRIDVTLNYNA